MSETIQHIDVGSISVAYTESGAGEPLLLLHGGEGNLHQYDIFRPLLGNGIKAIAYDQRDCGATVNRTDSYTIATLAEDCAGLITALGYDRAHVMGASFGGAIAMNLALLQPERLASLTLISTPISVPKASAGIAEQIMAMTAQERADFMLGAVLTPEAQRNDPELKAIVQSLIGQSASLPEARQAAIRTHDCEGRLSAVSVPTLVINGTDDPLVPVSTASLVADEIRGATLELVGGGRHGLTLEHRDVTASLVRNFVLAHPVL